MSDTVIPVPEQWRARAYWDKAKYDAAYAEALVNPDAFLLRARPSGWIGQEAYQGRQLDL